MRLRPQVIVVLSLCLAACQGAPAGLHGTRFEISLTIQPDGAVEAHEDIAVQFDAPAEGFDRVVRDPQADDLVFESAAVDGTAAAPGPGAPVTVRASGAHELAVHWSLASRAGDRHVFTVSYRAVRAVAVEDERGYLHWPAVPGGRAYPVDAARITVALPAGQTIDTATATGDGWTRALRPGDAVFDHGALAPGDGTWLDVACSVQRTRMTQPDWRLQADRSDELRPAWISAALFLLVIGVGVVWIVRFQYRAPGVSAEERRLVAIGLRRAALVSALLALATAGLIRGLMPSFGGWPYVVPVSMVACAAMWARAGI